MSVNIINDGSVRRIAQSILAKALFMLSIILVVPGTALSAQNNIKIAYVNFVRVIEQAPQSKAALKKLEAEFGPRDKTIVDLQNKIKQLEGKLEKEGLILKSVERRDIERELIRMKRDLRRISQEFREDYNLRRNEELASLQKMVRRVIEDIARQEKYDLILHEGALHYSKRVDITKKVLEILANKAR